MNLLRSQSFLLEEKSTNLKDKAIYLFEKLHNVNLFTLKFHILDNVIKDAEDART